MPPKQLSTSKGDKPAAALAADVSFADETGARASLKLEDMTRLARDQREKAAELLEDLAKRLRMPEDHDNPSKPSKTTALATTNGSKGGFTTVPALYSPERPSIALREKLDRMGRQSEVLMRFFGEEHEVLDRKDRMVMIDGSHRPIASWEDVEQAVYKNPGLQRAINELVPDPETGTPLLVPDFAGARVAMLLNAATLMRKKIISPKNRMDLCDREKEVSLWDSEVENHYYRVHYSKLCALQKITKGKHLNLADFHKTMAYNEDGMYLHGKTEILLEFDKTKRFSSGEFGKSKVGWTFIDATPHEASKRDDIFGFSALHKDSAHITGADIENIIGLFLSERDFSFKNWVLSNSGISQIGHAWPIGFRGDSDSLTIESFGRDFTFIPGSPRQVRVIVD